MKVAIQHVLQAIETFLFVNATGYRKGNHIATKRSKAMISKIKEWIAPKAWTKYICVKQAPNEATMSFHQYLAMTFGRVTVLKIMSVIARWKKITYVGLWRVLSNRITAEMKAFPITIARKRRRRRADTGPKYWGESPGNPVMMKSLTVVILVYFIMKKKSLKIKWNNEACELNRR